MVEEDEMLCLRSSSDSGTERPIGHVASAAIVGNASSASKVRSFSEICS